MSATVEIRKRIDIPCSKQWYAQPVTVRKLLATYW
jgi:hypothetical protein